MMISQIPLTKAARNGRAFISTITFFTGLITAPLKSKLFVDDASDDVEYIDC